MQIFQIDDIILTACAALRHMDASDLRALMQRLDNRPIDSALEEDAFEAAIGHIEYELRLDAECED